MGKIRIVETAPWMVSANDEAVGEADLVEVSDPDTGGAARFFHPGDEGELQMFEVRLPPETKIESHAHNNDEIIYVLAGELKLGARTLLPGSSVYVSRETLYGFRSGREGLRFLNFRATKDLSFLTKKDLMALRRSTENTQSAR
jgi:quercetin dioxygenase-like cupin family protein